MKTCLYLYMCTLNFACLSYLTIIIVPIPFVKLFELKQRISVQWRSALPVYPSSLTVTKNVGNYEEMAQGAPFDMKLKRKLIFYLTVLCAVNLGLLKRLQWDSFIMANSSLRADPASARACSHRGSAITKSLTFEQDNSRQEAGDPVINANVQCEQGQSGDW